MADPIYGPIIEQMVWSYSRVKSFHDCPYRWFLHYLCEMPGEEMFFSSYGSLMHSLLDGFYKGELTASRLPTEYLIRWGSEVRGTAPSEKVFQSYFRSGLSYLRDFKPVPYEVLCSELHVDLSVDGVPFTGIIDLVCRDSAGGLVIIDHKSRALKPRSSRKKPTQSDLELVEYLRQLYLYSFAVEEVFGSRPVKLCFNCFRTGVFIEEPYSYGAALGSRDWFVRSVRKIEETERFLPDVDTFRCANLCEHASQCAFYEMTRR